MNQIQAKHLVKRLFIYALVMLMVLTSYQPVQMSFAVEGVGFSVSPEYINTDQLPTIVTVTADASAFTVGSAYPTLINTATQETQSVSIVDSSATLMKFTVPAGVSAGTYEIRISDPEGDQGTTTKYYSVSTAYEVGQSTITTSAPFESLPKGYDAQENITVTGSFTKFSEGQTTVELLQSSAVIDTASVTDVTEGSGSTQTITFAVGTGLASGTYDVRFTTGSDVDTVSGGLVVRGAASIVLDTSSVTAGYSQTNVTVTGTNTGFSDATSVQILDSEGAATGKAGTANVTDEDTLGFSVKTGLAAGTYTVRITTGVEIANATFTVYAPSAQVKKQSDSSTLTKLGKYYSAQSLKLSGTNTNFASGETTLSVFKDSTQVTGAITGTPTVNSSTEVLFTLAAWTSSIATGDIEIKATTGGEETTATLSIVEPSVTLTYNSNAVVDDEIANGYKAFSVDIDGTDTYFTSSTVVEVMYSSTDYATGEVYTDAKNISFTLDAGLPEGTHTVTIDLDGTGAKTIETSLVVAPEESILSVSPSNILRTKSVTKTYTVYGSNTHFTAGTPSVDIDGTSSETISNVTVVDATTLTFDLIPSTVDVNGDLDLIVTVNSSAIAESATLTDGLTATNQGIEASPETYYTLERGNATVSVTAEGFTYDASVSNISATVGGTSVDVTRDSDTQISFELPSGVSTGSLTVAVNNNGSSYTTSISVQTSQETSNTPAFKIYGYGHNSDGDIVVQGNDTLTFSSGDAPTAVASINSEDYTVSVGSIDGTANTLTLTLPDGLSAGYYDIALTWSSGDYAGNTLTLSDYQIKNELDGENGIEIYYSGVEASSRTVYLNGAGTLSFTAIGDILNGSASTDKTAYADWASSDTSVATISAGTVTVAGRGTTTLSVAYDEASDSIALYVMGPDSIVIEGSDANIRIGESALLSATATYGDASTETVTSKAAWSASNSNLSLSGSTVTGVNSGQATVSAAYGGATGSLNLTVSSIDLTPSVVQSLKLGNVSVIIDGIETGTTITSLTLGGSSVTPSDDGTNISFVPPSGTAAGTAAVEVVASGQTHSAALTILESSMTLDTVILEEGYEAFDMVATLKNADVSADEEPEITVDGTLVSSADVTVDETENTVTFLVDAGLAAGTYDVVLEWTSGDYMGNTLTKSMSVAEEGSVDISISGASSVEIGSTTDLTLVATVDEVDQTLSGASWSSSDENIATVNSTGTVTGIAAGSVTITATFQSKTYTKTILVPSQTTETDNDRDSSSSSGGTGGGGGGTVTVGVEPGTGPVLTPDTTSDVVRDILENAETLSVEDVVRDLAVIRDSTVVNLRTGDFDIDEAKSIADSVFKVTEALIARSESTAVELNQTARDMAQVVGAYVARKDVEASDAVAWAGKVMNLVGTSTLQKAGQSSQQASAVAVDIMDSVVVKVLKKGIDQKTATAVFKTFMEDVAKPAFKLDAAKVDSAKLMDRIVKATSDIIELSGKIDKSMLVETQAGSGTEIKVDANALVLAANNAIQKKEELKNMVILNAQSNIEAQMTPRVGVDLPDTAADVKLSLDSAAVSGVQSTGAEMQISAKGAKFVFKNETLSEMKASGIELRVGEVGALEKTLYLKNMPMATRMNIAAVDNTKEIDMSGYESLINKPIMSLDFDDGVIFVPAHVNVFVYDEETAVWEYVKSEVDMARASVSFKPPHFSVYSVVDYSKTFDDLKAYGTTPAHWSKSYVEAMASRGLTSGISETEFGPDYTITRAQFATLLANALNLDGDTGSAFKDVKSGTWYYESVNRAYEAGLVSGLGNGMFQPDAQITREQMAVMISKAYEIMLGTAMKGEAEALKDIDDVSDWARASVEAAKYHGVISGYTDGSFKPKAFATRAEGVVMLKKLLDLK